MSYIFTIKIHMIVLGRSYGKYRRDRTWWRLGYYEDTYQDKGLVLCCYLSTSYLNEKIQSFPRFPGRRESDLQWQAFLGWPTLWREARGTKAGGDHVRSVSPKLTEVEPGNKETGYDWTKWGDDSGSCSHPPPDWYSLTTWLSITSRDVLFFF